MYKKELESEIKNISIVEKLIDEICAEYQLNSDVYGKLLLAVVEGVNNAIVHGNKLDKNKRVYLEYQLSKDELIFTITDEGEGFDYNNLPDPTTEENIEKSHGRGIFLMSHLTDKIEFNESGNQVKLFFSLS
ncbi:ATP-binding protein [Marinilabiliaceae bacterium ANBcel2]|nr:ATP-binding protein [Marinilabiliaceae bacterium ANBcel2]